jgi:hypothetical protein
MATNIVNIEKELRSIARDESGYADIKQVLSEAALVKEILELVSEIRDYGVASRGIIKANEIVFRINNLLSPNRVKSVAYVTPEAIPYIKTGGLGDVSGEYPQAAAIATRATGPTTTYGTATDNNQVSVVYIFLKIILVTQQIKLFDLEIQNISYWFVWRGYIFIHKFPFGFPPAIKINNIFLDK